MSAPVSRYQELVEQGAIPAKGEKRRFPPEVAKARTAENTRRKMEAQRRTMMVFKHHYSEEWAQVESAERKAIDTVRGPLPGDER